MKTFAKENILVYNISNLSIDADDVKFQFGFLQVTTPTTTATQPDDQYEDLAPTSISPSTVSAALSHTADQGVPSCSKLSTAGGKKHRTVNKANNESKSKPPTLSSKEMLRNVMTRIENSSSIRGDDFEDIDTIQLYLAAKEHLKDDKKF